jgi:hypothetical protein
MLRHACHRVPAIFPECSVASPRAGRRSDERWCRGAGDRLRMVRPRFSATRGRRLAEKVLLGTPPQAFSLDRAQIRRAGDQPRLSDRR